ncbi:MAG: metallophosphoesterase [Planctomycetota bacterium]
MPMVDRIAFLADVHLERHDRRRAQVFLRALRSLYAACSRIYVLGDLFEFWVGPAHVDYPDYRFVLDALDDILDGSTPVTVLHGNRDYFLGDRFPVGRGVTVEWDPLTIPVGPLRLFLCHGDLLLGHDKGYRFVRRLFHNRLVVRLNEILPPRVSYYYSHGYRNHSKRSVDRKRRAGCHVLRITSRAVTDVFEAGADVIVSGHVHEQASRYFSRSRPGKPWKEVSSPAAADGILYTLGSWESSAPVLLCESGRFSFHDLSCETLPSEHDPLP